MLIRSVFSGRALGACLLALGLLAGTGPARASEAGLTANYEVYVGGFQVARADLDVDLYKDCFDVRLAAEPDGLVSFIADFKIVSWAGGCRAEEGVTPASYSSDYFKNGRKKRWVRVDYNGQDAPAVRTDPEPEDDNRSMVPSDQRAGSLDPLSGSFAIIQAVTREGRCQGERPVYDGRRLFKLKLEHVGPAVLKKSRYAAYSGPAIECLVRVEMIAGFKKSEIRKKHFPERVKVFLAEAVPGAPLIPVRLESDYRFGQLRMHAAEITPRPEQTKETRAR